MPDWRTAIDDFLTHRAELLQAVRRHLHAHPDASGNEQATVQSLARRLKEEGVPHQLIPSGRGIIAGTLERGREPIVALRADLDALHITDQKTVPYRSTRDGLMHACGHDAHTAMLLGACLALHHLADRLPAPLAWRALFQPSEETAQGAAEMVGAGAMQGVAAIVALHVDPDREVGQVGHRAGVLTACCEEFHAKIRGKGGHGARPHQAIDPILAGVAFVQAVSQQIPRSVDSREPVVVTFGSFTGGTDANVIPEKVILRGTVRTLSREIARDVERRLVAIARGTELTTGTTIELTFIHGPGAVVNDAAVTELLARAAAEVVGAERVRPIERPSLGGEDFATYLEHAPGCLLRLGVAAPGSESWPLLHSPLFDIDERALLIGARILARGAVMLSQRLAQGPLSERPSYLSH